MSFLSRYRAAYDFDGPIIVGYAFFVQNGGWKSIYHYFRHREAAGQKVKLIDRRNIKTRRQLFAAFMFGRHVIFNGLDCFWRWEALLFCLLRRDTFIYLHDTEHMLDGFAKNYPWRHRALARAMRRNPLLCVSAAAAQLYRERFGATRTHVVYENLAPRRAPDFDPAKRHVLMVGALDPRKGVDLFSATADRAAAAGKPWQFHWLGGIAAKDAGRRSENVTWWGWVDNVDEFLTKADVFFLSSVDDPFPLGCLEALRARRRCIVFKKTGLAEVLRGVAGCAVYEEHEAGAALAALEKVFGETPDEAVYARLQTGHIDVNGFTERLDAILRGGPEAK